MKGMRAPHSPSKITRNPLNAPRLRRICSIPAMRITSRIVTFFVGTGLTPPRHYPDGDAVFRDRGGIVRDVDTRRLVPRTDLLLADPRLAAAERRLGRTLVQ